MADVWQDNTLKLDGSRVIDRNIYVDPDIFAAEQEKIFAKTWQWVAHESEMSEIGDYVSATIAGRPIVVARDDDGKIKAFYNTCTHRGALLAVRRKGNNGGSFTCMYHAWCFDNGGKLLSAPQPEAYGENIKDPCYNIPTIRAETFAGNVFVCLDAEAAPLEAFLGASAPYIQMFTGESEVIGRVRWMLEGNWKLWHENFRDNYHPMYAHVAIGVNYQGVTIEGTNHDIGQGHSLLAFPPLRVPSKVMPLVRKVTGKDVGGGPPPVPPAPAAEGEDDRNLIMAVFPNLDFQHARVGFDHDLLQTVQPLSPDRAIVEIVVFGRKGEPEEVRRKRLETTLDGQAASGKISGDDTEAARRCSAGFATVREVRWSNMDRGQAPGDSGVKNDEYSLRAFYVAYKQHLGESLRPAHLEQAS